MSVELSLLKCFCDSREIYNQYYPYLKDIDNMDRDIKLLFNLIDNFYKNYNQEAISKNDIAAYYDYLYPTSKNKNYHIELIGSLFGIKVNIKLAYDVLEKMMERHYASKVVNSLVPVLESNKWGVLHDAKSLIEEYIRKMKYPPSEAAALKPHSMDIHDLVNEVIDPSGYSWPIEELNNSLGPARPKTLGLIYAYSDTGKTSFVCRCMAHWANQLMDDECIVYAGNEEGAERIDQRLTHSFLNWSNQQVKADIDRADKLRKERGFNRVKLFDKINHINLIMKLLEDYEPKIIIIDQLRKIQGDTQYRNEVNQIEAVANWCRDRAKDFNTTIIGTTQGDATTLPKKYLDLTDVYNVKVALQGELDFAIGIGRDIRDMSKENYRFFHLPKNKFGAHSRFAVFFQEENNVWRPI